MDLRYCVCIVYKQWVRTNRGLFLQWDCAWIRFITQIDSACILNRNWKISTHLLGSYYIHVFEQILTCMQYFSSFLQKKRLCPIWLGGPVPPWPLCSPRHCLRDYFQVSVKFLLVTSTYLFMLCVFHSFCRAADRHSRVDQRSGRSWYSIPGLPHIHHASSVPWHRGAPCP